MNRRLQLFVALARRLPHPDPPSPRYLSLLRAEPRPRRLLRKLAGVPSSVSVTDHRLALAHGSARARTYRPCGVPATERLPLVISFHGGGFVFGNLAQTDWLCGRVSAGARTVVVSVSYRLAPEHPAPIPFQDCWAATCRLLERTGDLGVDPARVVVMGASAGGNLAALVAIAHRDRTRAEPGWAPPLAYQILIYPATDLSLSSPSVTELSTAPILTRQILDWYGRQYLPGGSGGIASHDPGVSPVLHPDLAGCAPALILAAGQDPLRDDSTRYGEALARDGVTSQVVVYPDAIHGFVSMPALAPEAGRALAEIVATLRTLQPRA